MRLLTGSDEHEKVIEWGVRYSQLLAEGKLDEAEALEFNIISNREVREAREAEEAKKNE